MKTHKYKRSSTKRTTRSSTKRTKRSRKYRHYKKMRGGYAPFIGGTPDNSMPSPYNPFSGGKPVDVGGSGGTYYSQSASGIPSGASDPPMPSNPQFFSGGGKRKRSGHKRSGTSKRSGHKRSGHKRSGTSKRSGYKQGGGGFFSNLLPDEIVNIGRSIPAALGRMTDQYNGVLSHPSDYVYPTQQNAVPISRGGLPNVYVPNMGANYSAALQSVSDML
jgi:hypothetical protein